MYSWWVERPDLTNEVSQLMNSGDFVVYEDAPHSCFHVMRGNDEWTSVLAPWEEIHAGNPTA